MARLRPHTQGLLAIQAQQLLVVHDDALSRQHDPEQPITEPPSLKRDLATPRPQVAITLTPGNIADITIAIPLLATVAPPRRLLADKAYDADSLRSWLAARNVKAVIPSTASRRTPYPLDRRIYRQRNGIEKLFGRLKNWRRIATHYDRHAQNFLAAIALLASVAEWLKLWNKIKVHSPGAQPGAGPAVNMRWQKARELTHFDLAGSTATRL
jgi:transposase